MVLSCQGCDEDSYKNLDNRAYSAHCRGYSGVLFKSGGDNTGPNKEQTTTRIVIENEYSNPPII